jgi:hypothetical protein
MNNDGLAKALEQFIYNNPDLERLEAILDVFSPFTAMKWERQETRHSAFLRWILDPSETHGLGPYFLRSFLKMISYQSSGTTSPNVFEVDSWDLTDATVEQESENIDILIQSEKDRFVVVIENKVDTREHSNQLRRYRSAIEKQYQDYKQLYVYLTIEGEIPSDDQYLPIDYAQLASLIDETIVRRGDQLSTEVQTFLNQYVEMVRRHIVEDSEVQALCRQIYDKHRSAIDALFEHKPDRALEVHDILLKIIKEHTYVEHDHSSKAAIRFIPKKLDFIPKVGDGWTKSKRLLLFEFENYGRLRLKVLLGPGNADVRAKYHSLISTHPKVFNRADQQLYPKWWMFHVDNWINKNQYTDLSLSDLEEEIRKHWDRFFTKSYPKLESILVDHKEELSRIDEV